MGYRRTPPAAFLDVVSESHLHCDHSREEASSADWRTTSGAEGIAYFDSEPANFDVEEGYNGTSSLGVSSMAQTAITRFVGDYAWLSNFYKGNPIVIDVGHGITRYKTAEHAYQAAKATTETQHLIIASAITPGAAKRQGRKVQLPENWDEKSHAVMEKVLRVKFEDKELKKKLKATEPLHLCEGNFWCDNHWGHCICRKCKGLTKKNLLGKLLMQIRNEL